MEEPEAGASAGTGYSDPIRSSFRLLLINEEAARIEERRRVP